MPTAGLESRLQSFWFNADGSSTVVLNARYRRCGEDTIGGREGLGQQLDLAEIGGLWSCPPVLAGGAR